MMSSLPTRIHIKEEGPREGFQFEKGPIPTARKIELIDALARTGVKHMQIVSFVSPKAVPGMADAEEVVRGIRPEPGVAYTGLWFNPQGLERAIGTGRLEIKGSISFSASAKFLHKNLNRTPQEQIEVTRGMIAIYKQKGIEVERATIMAAFGCNFEGDVPPSRAVEIVQQILDLAGGEGVRLACVSLADTMAWATPLAIKRTVGAVRERFPGLELELHLHDTRGMGIANACAGLEMGITRFDASVAGLGGCPFAGHAGAAGNVCTEDLVFL
ncbi:MAG: hydroxymethylglutaryl-CoA lyase, partial [Betaproteobacteria bacterium]|nr:hydroxymethylglutaryl-CoA lyase [Betaproteobacteria bacterium]